MKAVFLDILLSVNHKRIWYRGERINKGCTAISITSIQQNTGLSRRVVVDALEKLVSSGEITRCKYKYGIITKVNRFSYFQGDEPDDGSLKNKPVSEPPSEPVSEPSGKPKSKPVSEPPSEPVSELKQERKELKNNNSLTGVNAHAPAHEKFLNWLKEECPYLRDNLDMPTPEQLEKLKARYGTIAVAACCQQIENRKDLRKRYKSLYRTLDNWLKRDADRGGMAKDTAREAMTMQEKGKDYYDDGEEWK